MRKKFLLALAFTSAIGGAVSTGIGAYESFGGHLKDTEGANAVTKCVENNEACSLEEFQKAAEFSTRQDRAGEKIIAGNVLFMSAFAMLITSMGSGNIQSRRKPPKPPKK